MSFRTRLTGFFLLIVLIPMTAVGFLVFRLINDSQQGKADARANGIASAAVSFYQQASRSATYDARTVARALQNASGKPLQRRASALVAQVGIVRVTVSDGRRTIADVGRHNAVAPGVVIVRAAAHHPVRTITLSELAADEYAGQVSGEGSASSSARAPGPWPPRCRCRRVARCPGRVSSRCPARPTRP
jgi:hypothetical protein